MTLSTVQPVETRVDADSHRANIILPDFTVKQIRPMAGHRDLMFYASTLSRGMVTVRLQAKLVLSKVEKYLLINGVTLLGYEIYVHARAIFLAFWAHFGYHSAIVVERRFNRNCFFERPNGEVLLRNLAALCIQQEADIVSGDRQLYCLVLDSVGFSDHFLPLAFGRLFYAPATASTSDSCLLSRDPL
jgi:hypothetical protein